MGCGYLTSPTSSPLASSGGSILNLPPSASAPLPATPLPASSSSPSPRAPKMKIAVNMQRANTVWDIIHLFFYSEIYSVENVLTIGSEGNIIMRFE